MKKIVLLCAAGMSTSMLVTKMRNAAADENFECTIDAHPTSKAESEGKDADCVLLGPQVRFELGKIKTLLTCPCEAIEMSAYGMMDGKKVLDQAKKLMGV